MTILINFFLKKEINVFREIRILYDIAYIKIFLRKEKIKEKCVIMIIFLKMKSVIEFF